MTLPPRPRALERLVRMPFPDSAVPATSTTSPFTKEIP
jgi:hypothetical protein